MRTEPNSVAAQWGKGLLFAASLTIGLGSTNSWSESAAQALGALNAPRSSLAQRQQMVAEIVAAINSSVHFPSGVSSSIGPDHIGQFTYRKDGNDLVYCGEVIGMNLPVSYSGYVRFIASGGNATVEHPVGTYMEQIQFARLWNQFCGT